MLLRFTRENAAALANWTDGMSLDELPALSPRDGAPRTVSETTCVLKRGAETVRPTISARPPS